MKRTFRSLLFTAAMTVALATRAAAHGLHAPAPEPVEHVVLHGLQILGLTVFVVGLAVWVWRRARR